jgi:hypothetical protein
MNFTWIDHEIDFVSLMRNHRATLCRYPRRRFNSHGSLRKHRAGDVSRINRQHKDKCGDEHG